MEVLPENLFQYLKVSDLRSVEHNGAVDLQLNQRILGNVLVEMVSVLNRTVLSSVCVCVCVCDLSDCEAVHAFVCVNIAGCTWSTLRRFPPGSSCRSTRRCGR